MLSHILEKEPDFDSNTDITFYVNFLHHYHFEIKFYENYWGCLTSMMLII